MSAAPTPTCKNSTGGTALLFAVMFGRHELLTILLDAGADQSIQDARGFTARHLANQQGDQAALALLA